MWKLVSAYSLLLFVSTIFLPAISGQIYQYCADLNYKIDKHMHEITTASNHSFHGIEGTLSALSRLNFWRNVQKRKNLEPPELHYDEGRGTYQLKYLPEIDDSECRLFIGELSIDMINKCVDFMTFVSSASQDEVKEILANSIRYFQGNKIADVGCEECAEWCRNMIQSLDYVAVWTITKIRKISQHFYSKIMNYERDFIYCIAGQMDGNPALYKRWYNECSYYTKP